MENFLTDNYSLLTRLVEAMAAFTGLLCLKKFKHTNTKYFIWFLVYVLIIELIGSYTSYIKDFEFLSKLKEQIKGTIFQRNSWYYTLFWTIGSAVFYSFYFQKILKNKYLIDTLKILTRALLVFSFVVIVTDIDEFFARSSSQIKIFSSLLIIMAVIFYFMEVLLSNRILTFYKSLNFYISATLFIFFLIITPLTFYNIYYSQADWNFVFLRQHIYLISNIFMYTTFTFALIFCKPEND